MVGRAGRSKACKTCKQRRKGCDLSHPACLRCISAGLVCGGYEHHFIVYQAAPPDQAQQLAVRRQGERLDVLKAPLHRSAVKSGYFGSAWSSLHCFDGEPVSHSWILDFPSVHVRETALHSAYAAVALARIGQRDGTAVLIQQSHVAYARALSKTSRRLSSDNIARDDETLACMLLLALYEATHGSSTEHLASMLTHLQAARKLAEHRGPSSFKSRASCTMLADMYRAFVPEAIGRREASFLSAQPWQKQMQKAPSRPTQDDLTDIFAQFPNVMRQFDLLRSLALAEIEISDILQVHRSYTDLMDQIKRWRSGSDIAMHFLYLPSTILDPEIDQHLIDLVPQTRHYPRILDAKTNMTYLIANMVLDLEILQLHQLTATWQPQKDWKPGEAAEVATLLESTISPAQAMNDAQGYCDAIVESVEQFLQPKSGVLAAGAVVFPIMMAVGYLAPQKDPRVEYLLTLAKRYQASSRYPLANIVFNAMVHNAPS